MLKIRKLKIDIETVQNKKFGAFYSFEPNKLNVIKGSNHSGKTTIVSAIFYCLGMEELFGGQNTKALDSILTSVVPFNGLEYQINESSIYLEIENSDKKVITIKRYSRHIDISPKILYIYDLHLKDLKNSSDKIITYIHDSGSAQNSLGFYKYLENYLGYKLPNVPSYKEGKEVKLYLQVIFNSYFVEQLRGWTDFFATIPNFGIKNPRKRIIEFLLNLDASEFEKNKFKYEQEKERIYSKWIGYVESLKQSVEQISANIELEYDKPISIDKFENSKFKIYFINENDERINLYSDITYKKSTLELLNEQIQKPKSKMDEKLFNIRAKVKKIARKISKINEIIGIKTNELRYSNQELVKVTSEITNLTDLQKIERYIKEDTITSKITKNICPTCQQKIDTSFYSKIEVMGITENKEYLSEQKKILSVYIQSIENEIGQQKEIVTFLKSEYSDTQKIIEYLERDIQLNTNMSSYKEIVDLESKIKSHETVQHYSDTIKEELTVLAREWKKNEMAKTSHNMSDNDRAKITLLEKYFKTYLTDFGYGSKEITQINISKKQFEQYFPVVKIDGRDEKIRINSSASDFVRSLWAYYISLFEVSKSKNGNHIGLFIFDEPAQHAMVESDQKVFLERLSKLDRCQSIVFSSFEDKDNSSVGKEKFTNMINNIAKSNIHIIEIKEHSIQNIT